MAKLYGVEIKSLKKFFGHEGEPCYQGTVYYNGKKLGAWSNDSWGGPDMFDFNEYIFNDAVETYKQSLPDNEYKKFTNADIFMGALTELALMEKEFKKYAKKGYKVLVKIGDDWSYMLVALTQDDQPLIDNEVKKYRMRFTKPRVTVYRSLNDFVIQ